MDQAAGPVPRQHLDTWRLGQAGVPAQRWVLLQCPVWPVGVEVIGVLVEDEAQVPFACDQDLVQAFAADAADQRSPIAFARAPGWAF